MSDATGALEALFNPQAVAVIGASTDRFKFGGLPVHFSLSRGFTGRLYPVNDRVSEVQGLPAYPNIGAIDGPVDCAVVSVPAPAVPETLAQCATKGVRVAAVFSSGFAELGAVGREAQMRIAETARAAGMRLLGPNCMGAFCVGSGFYATFNTSFEHYDGRGWPKPGRIGVVSQSGAVGVQIFVLLRDRGLGFAKWVSTGNQCDRDIADCIAYFAADPETATIVCQFEGCRDGAKLMAALAAARAAGKPVIALKVGRSDSGAAAVASHTASLAGDDAVFDAAFRQCGAYRVTTFMELVDVAAAVDGGRYPRSANVGVVSTSGGTGVMMADLAEEYGLRLPPPTPAIQAVLRDIVPYAATANPIDTTAPGMTDMDVMALFVEHALANGYPMVAVFLAHLGLSSRRFDVLGPRLRALRVKYPDPVIALIVLCAPELRDSLTDDGFLVYDDPSRTVTSLAALVRIGKSLERPAARAATRSRRMT